MSTQAPAPLRPALPRLLLLGGLLLLLVAVAWKTFRIYRVVDSLLAREQAITALLEVGPLNAPVADLEEQVLGLRSDVVALRSEIGFLLPLTPYLGWMPEVGPLLVAAEPLLDMADHGTAAGVFLFRSLSPALEIVADDSGGGLMSRLPELLSILSAAEADVVQARLAVDNLVAARAAIPEEEALPWRVQQLLVQADQYLPLAQDGLALLPVLPAMAGGDAPVTFLLVVQNEDELRPTGGFISGAGLLTLEQGRIAGLDFSDANVVDRLLEESTAYDYPPDPLLQFMGLEYFLFRDANFWPDFPTSAEQMLDLYELGQGVRPDGVVAINQRFVQMLLGVTGPVNVPAMNMTLTATDIIPVLREAWNPNEGQTAREWLVNRKAFIGLFAAALLTHVESDPLAMDPVALLNMTEQAVAGRHLQIYMRDPAAAAVLRQIGWDGHVANQSGSDVLFLVETNVGYSKANAQITRSLSHELVLDADGGGTATTTITFVHQLARSDAPCVQLKPYTTELTYAQLLDDCYWNYVRLLVPAGSRLIDASRHTAPAAAFETGRGWSGSAGSGSDPGGLTVFDNFLLLTRGETANMFFSYALPPATTVTNPDGSVTYRLQLYKQASLPQLPLTINVTLPPGTELLQVDSGNTGLDVDTGGGSVRLTGAVSGDGAITIRYNPSAAR